MSALLARLEERHRLGHTDTAIDLFSDQRLDDITEFHPAAVLIAVTDDDVPSVLLLHRPLTMRSHPGQVAFPGGRTDPGENATEAALREAHEELGIDPAVVRVIGCGDIYKTHSGFEITPVLAMVPPDLHIQPNPDEVSDWFAAPLAHVLDPANHQAHTMEWGNGMHTFYQIDWQGHQIWGITAALIVNLSRRLRWHD